MVVIQDGIVCMVSELSSQFPSISESEFYLNIVAEGGLVKSANFCIHSQWCLNLAAIIFEIHLNVPGPFSVQLHIM